MNTDMYSTVSLIIFFKDILLPSAVLIIAVIKKVVNNLTLAFSRSPK